MDGSSGRVLAAREPVRDEHDVTSTLGRRAIGDAQVPVHRIARLREHGGSLSRGAGRAVRIGSVYAAHKRFPEVYFSAVGTTICSKHSGAGTTTSSPTAPSCGRRQTASATPHVPAADCYFHPYADPLRQSPRAGRPTPSTETNRGLMMPRRKATRIQNRTKAINDERRHNQNLVAAEAAERNRPPPF